MTTTWTEEEMLYVGEWAVDVLVQLAPAAGEDELVDKLVALPPLDRATCLEYSRLLKEPVPDDRDKSYGYLVGAVGQLLMVIDIALTLGKPFAAPIEGYSTVVVMRAEGAGWDDQVIRDWQDARINPLVSVNYQRLAPGPRTTPS